MTRFAIGVDIGGTSVKFGVVSSNGKILNTCSRKTNPDSKILSNAIQDGIKYIIDSGSVDKLDHIGIASPGAVNVETGVVFDSCPNIPGWVGTNLKEVAGVFGYPVYADNDANAACLGELKAGSGTGFKNILYVTIGTGVGGGIIINGSIYHGADYCAAEIGHIIIRPGGRKCGCGNKGCMETYASITGMMKTARLVLLRRRSGILWKLVKGDISKLRPEMITSEFKKGDPVAVEIINKQAESLAQGTAGALNLLNPELLIIGGAISESGFNYIRCLSKTINQNTFPAVSRRLKTVRARLGGRAGTVGAAFLGWVK